MILFIAFESSKIVSLFPDRGTVCKLGFSAMLSVDHSFCAEVIYETQYRGIQKDFILNLSVIVCLESDVI